MSTFPPDPGAQPPADRRKGFVVGPKQAAVVLLLVLVVWFVAVNRDDVKITFWLVDVTAALWLVLGGTFAVGVITGLLLGRRKK